MKNTVILFLITIMLAGCLDDLEDDRQYPITSIPDEVNLATVAMTESYQYQYYYDLSRNAVAAQSSNSAWDLAFDNSPGGRTIYLNTSNFMMAAGADTENFEAVTSTEGVNFSFDRPAGSNDSIALAAWWRNPQQVYIIDRGINHEGTPLGYKKMVFSLDQQEGYIIRYADMDGNNEVRDTISKSETPYNRVMYSFENGGEVKYLEPAGEDWDLWFTQYTKMLYAQGEPYPYLVVGALSNRSRIETAQLNMPFRQVDAGVADTVTFYPYADLIGYDWKELTGDVESGDVSYVIRPDITYLIREKDKNLLYKLRFTGFYDQKGRKGFPAFEYQQIFR